MMTSSYDFTKSQVLRRRQKVKSDAYVVIPNSSVFQIRGPTTTKAQLPTVKMFNISLISKLYHKCHMSSTSCFCITISN